jgi:hypothetical protein
MGPVMKVTTLKERSMDMVNSLGLMAAPTMDSLLRIILMDLVFINGLMAENMKENGRTIRWKEAVFLHGQTIEGMRVSISMIKRRVMECSSGLMVENTTEIGKTVNNMVQEHIHQPQEKQDKGNGLMEKELDGYEIETN